MRFVREHLKDCRRIVVKVGTSTITYPNGRLNLKRVEELAWVLTDLRNRGKDVILVSSGAIGGCVAGVALSKSPSEDYRHFGKTMMTVSLVMLVLSFICCVLGTAAGAFSNIMYETF